MLLRPLGVILLAMCGCDFGGSTSPPDAPPDAPPVFLDAPVVVDAPPPLTNLGFVKPTRSLKANTEQSPDTWVEVGAADLGCLGTPTTDQATTVAVSLSTTTHDFQSGNLVPNATITVFPNQTFTSPFVGSPYTSDGNAAVTVNIPVNTKRFGFKITNPNALPTYIFGAIVNPTQATQTAPPLESVSTATAATLPALIAVSRTPGTGLVLGRLRDCQGREVSNFIATISTTSGTVAHAPGADTYYFSASVGLPVRHSQLASASADGQFMIVQLAPAATAFIQVWGYATDAALQADQLTLVAERSISVLGDAVITGELSPIRTP